MTRFDLENPEYAAFDPLLLSSEFIETTGFTAKKKPRKKHCSLGASGECRLV